MRRKQRCLVWMIIILVLYVLLAGIIFMKKNKADDPAAETELSEETSLDDGTVNTGGKKSLVMAVEVPLDAPYGKLALAYKENVEEMSGGALAIDIYENGLLGLSAELISSIGDDSNASDIMMVPVHDLVDAGCTDTAQLLELYRFSGHDGFLKWLSSKEAEALLAEPERNGLGAKGLFFAEDGFSHLFLKENSRSINGKRIAAEANSRSEEYISQIGGVYEYLPSIDIKDALVDGSLDGVERDCRFYQENALWEAAPYIVTDSHLFSPCEALIKLDSAEKLSAEELDILYEAGEKTAEAFTETIRQEEQAMLDEFTGHGAEIVKLN